MVITYLRMNNIEKPITLQRNLIIEYAKFHGIVIDREEIEDSPLNVSIDKREYFYDVLHNILKEFDEIIIDDLWILGNRIGEIVKILNCLIKRNITLHLSSQNIIINSKLPISILLEILDRQREVISKKNITKTGRPKGSLSKSKFDKYKEEIIQLLRKRVSVTEIASRLNVCRSSLKDYINSRSLKEFALIDKSIEKRDLKQQSFLLPDVENCKSKK